MAWCGGVCGSFSSSLSMDGPLCTPLDWFFTSGVSGQARHSMHSRCLPQSIIAHKISSTTGYPQIMSLSLLESKY